MTDFSNTRLPLTSTYTLENVYLRYIRSFYNLERVDNKECNVIGALWCFGEIAIQTINGKKNIDKFGILLKTTSGEYDCITAREFSKTYIVKDINATSTDAIEQGILYTDICEQCISSASIPLERVSHHTFITVSSKDVSEGKIILKTLKEFFTVSEDDSVNTFFITPMDAYKSAGICP